MEITSKMQYKFKCNKTKLLTFYIRPIYFHKLLLMFCVAILNFLNI